MLYSHVSRSVPFVACVKSERAEVSVLLTVLRGWQLKCQKSRVHRYGVSLSYLMAYPLVLPLSNEVRWLLSGLTWSSCAKFGSPESRCLHRVLSSMLSACGTCKTLLVAMLCCQTNRGTVGCILNSCYRFVAVSHGSKHCT